MHRLFVASLAATALLVVLVRPVLGTPGENVISGAILARGDFITETSAKFTIKTAAGTEVAAAKGAGDVLMQKIELGPNGSTGWHTHPGPAVAVIQSGSLTILSPQGGGCESTTYVAGDVFVDPGQGHVHLGRSGSDGATVFVTYFDVPAAAAGPRIDAPDPGGC